MEIPAIPGLDRKDAANRNLCLHNKRISKEVTLIEVKGERPTPDLSQCACCYRQGNSSSSLLILWSGMWPRASVSQACSAPMLKSPPIGLRSISDVRSRDCRQIVLPSRSLSQDGPRQKNANFPLLRVLLSCCDAAEVARSKGKQ